MIKKEDELWLKKVLEDCFSDSAEAEASRKCDLEGFKLLASAIIKNIEINLKEIYLLWKADPDSAELKDKFLSLNKSLFYLKRYCGPR